LAPVIVEVVIILIKLPYTPMIQKMANRLGNRKEIQEMAVVDPLISMLNQFYLQDENVINYFRENITPVTFKRGDLLVKSGAFCDHIYFIKKGVLRGIIREGKKDITTWVSADNELVTSISSIDLQTTSFENIEAIENCELLAISNEAMNDLYIRFPDFNITGRKLLQKYYRDAEKRAYISRLNKAETKYSFFLENYSHLANRIQLRYIASFLGITLETLSRVRKKLSSTSG
jgi:CRP-like cAMP-binding protein